MCGNARNTVATMSKKTTPLSIQLTCAECHIKTNTPVGCPMCHLAIYCSIAHQTSHWHRVHKHHCRVVARESQLALACENIFTTTTKTTLAPPHETMRRLGELRKHNPRDFMTNRVLGMEVWRYALLPQHDKATRRKFLELALDLLMYTEIIAVQGTTARSPRTCMQLYHALVSIPTLLLRLHGGLAQLPTATPDMAALLQQWQHFYLRCLKKKRRFQILALKQLVTATTTSEALRNVIQQNSKRNTKDMNASYQLCFHVWPVLQTLGIDAWSVERQKQVLSHFVS